MTYVLLRVPTDIHMLKLVVNTQILAGGDVGKQHF